MSGGAKAEAAGAGQEAIVAFLSGLEGDVQRIDTHASIVFLARDRVFKVKRAVKLPFLDYSTLAKRKLACEEELAVNARNAPAIYRRVVSITREADGLALAGTGPVVEWAVEMARFDERRTLDRLAETHAVPADAAEALADAMLQSHRRAPVADGTAWPASIASIIDRNIAEFRRQRHLPGPDVERLHDLSHRHLQILLPLLRQRADKGLVRRCHGDAHLANIALIDGKPVLFDAIEFDPAIATTDVLYDLAFAIMDFLHFGDAGAANRLFNRYVAAAWPACADAFTLWPLFLSMRAAIRSLVQFTKHRLCPDDPLCLRQADEYFRLALKLIEPGEPHLIAIGGRSGTGKSVLARQLAGRIGPAPGAVLLRSDIIRKELSGVDPLTRLPAASYTLESSHAVYGEMFARARNVLAQGLSVVLDAAFLQAAERDAATDIATRAGVGFRGAFLVAAPAIRAQRIAARRGDASDATAEVALRQETIDAGPIGWPQVDASGSADDTLERCAGMLPASAQLCIT